MARWLEQLQEYDFAILHRQGKSTQMLTPSRGSPANSVDVKPTRKDPNC